LKFKKWGIDFSLPYVIPTNPALVVGAWRNLKRALDGVYPVLDTVLEITMAYKQNAIYERVKLFFL